MDLSKVLHQLRQELQNLDAAIFSLERLQREGRRRGRPPKMLSAVLKASRAARQGSGDADPANTDED
jgi:hypothetical protein